MLFLAQVKSNTLHVMHYELAKGQRLDIIGIQAPQYDTHCITFTRTIG